MKDVQLAVMKHDVVMNWCWELMAGGPRKEEGDTMMIWQLHQQGGGRVGSGRSGRLVQRVWQCRYLEITQACLGGSGSDLQHAYSRMRFGDHGQGAHDACAWLHACKYVLLQTCEDGWLLPWLRGCVHTVRVHVVHVVHVAHA